MDIIAGNPSAFNIPLIIGTQPVAPDAGSVTYTIKDQTGKALQDLTDVAYPFNGTIFQVQLLIPSSAHSIAVGRRFERRTLVVKMTTNGQEVQISRTYRVVPDPIYSITPAEVRAYIGIEDHELPDADIDILSAFLVVEKDVGATVLNAALASGTTDELAANTLIRMRAVLDVLPSAKQRMAQTEKNGVKQFSRVDLKELDKLEVKAAERYKEAYDEIVIATETNLSLFLTTSNTDAITG